MSTSSSYHPTPLCVAARRGFEQHHSPWLVIGDFLDDWARFPDLSIRESLIQDEIFDSCDEEWHRWEAFMAAMVEHLTRKEGMPTPLWVFDSRWTLPVPWFLNPYWKLRAWMLVATPPAWKRRRIFGGDETMMIGRA